MTLPKKMPEVGSHKDFRRILPVYFRSELSALSPHTLRAKKADLGHFFCAFNFLCGSLEAEMWDPSVTRFFMDSLIKAGAAPATINRRLATIRSFGNWLRDQGILTNNPTKGIREFQLPSPTPKGLSDLEFARLKKASDSLIMASRPSRSQDFRNKVILLALESSGLRVSELLGLKITQFDIGGRKFRNVRCKGGKIRDARIKSEVADLVTEYIQNHRLGGSEFLFTNRYGGALSRNGICKAFDKIVGVMNAFVPASESIDKLNPHRLRHRAGYKARAIKDVVWAQKKLGHSSLRYVEKYATLSEEEEAALTEQM
jgi:site-specific recombinase XerD